MKQQILILAGLLLSIFCANGQSVGIGTTTPNTQAILELSSTNKVFLPPKMTEDQMKAMGGVPEGSLIFNTTQRQLMGYTYTHTNIFNLNGHELKIDQYAWLPLNTGPRMAAWGYVDSFATQISGSGNYTIDWDGYNTTNSGNNWYRLGLKGASFDKDSMILLVTAVGNGSWDQAIAIGELSDTQGRAASIKFSDISRMIQGGSGSYVRRRSSFYFVLYDLRKTYY